ncbi:uncharacterized protein LOC113233164 isoform X2 [Hyposmocoma kahamanoa]|uniref:uncharacterized protein LOC113233164 isoform X2 n=1 Tax=Hyposmocoma kahamanoa TaxID=1477025 RepID=UPI000E6D89EB|nr:uncharacterized protein LOC113233164 isoform X2 [Hyposmocoma kahamanoa]
MQALRISINDEPNVFVDASSPPESDIELVIDESRAADSANRRFGAPRAREDHRPIWMTDLSSEVRENFRAIFELWKSGEVHKRIPFKVPPVEPLPMPPFCDNINKLGVKAYVETGILNFYGLKEMTLDKIDVSDTAHDITVSMSAPKVHIHSDTYSISGKAMYVYKVKGTGTLDITLFNVKGSGKIHLKGTDTGTEIDQLTVKIACEKAEGNLQNASWPINNLINTKGRQLVEAFKTEIQSIAMKQVQKIFGEPLSRIKFDDLLQYMKDILDDTLLSKSLKRSNSEDGFYNSTYVDNDIDVSTVPIVENDLDHSTDTVVKDSLNNSPDVEDTLKNSTDFRKIRTGSQTLRDRN